MYKISSLNEKLKSWSVLVHAISKVRRMFPIWKRIGILMHQAQQAFLEGNLVTCARNLTIMLASNPTFLHLQTHSKDVTNDACEKIYL